jgi:hypothetical protein
VKYSSLKDFLEKHSISHSQFVKKETWKVQQKWRETFSRKVKEQEGKWIYRGFDWHTFSYDFAKYKGGANAFELYKQIDVQDYFIISEDEDSPSFLCSSAKVPDFSNLWGDFYVFPETVEWTMVFTHEDGLGPYFSRKEWQ